ncbi:unnamed protein product [Allacma fusca]|uniref:BTB domain-containing protein n=1 Tax=Allacma fusca TaxID=39272 RepID=A0A8J2KRP0_9HEXA|nr:unnamed protein product [Allacma fusca]
MPSFSKYFITNLRRLNDFRRPYYADAKLRGTPTNNEKAEPRILVHRIVLVLNSPYFEKLVKKGRFSYQVPIPPKLLEDLVTYMYTGEMPIITAENVFELLKACHLLELSEALENCRDFLKSGLLAIKDINADCGVSPAFPGTEVFKLEKLVSLRGSLPLGSISTGKILKGLLNWVLEDVKDRQKHFLPLMQTIPINEIPADLMKECVITLNSSYQSLTTPSSSNLTKQIELSTPNLPQDPAPKSKEANPPSTHPHTPRSDMDVKSDVPRVLFTISSKDSKSEEISRSCNNKHAKKRKQSAKSWIPSLGNQSKSSIVPKDLVPCANAAEPTPMKLSNPPDSLQIPSPIMGENADLPAPRRLNLSPFKVKSVVRVEKLIFKDPSESNKRESQFDETMPINERLQTKKIRLAVAEDAKKELPELDSGTLKKSSAVIIKKESRNLANDAAAFEVGSLLEDISAYHPLMLYLCEKPNKKYNIEAYDFREKKSAVIIENAAVDRYNYGMALKGQTIFLIGGRNDNADFFGSNGHECLSTVISFENFLHISNDKIRTVKYHKDLLPNYANHCLQQSRSNFGVAVRGNKIFVIGGHAKTNTPLRSLKSSEMFDSDLGTWKSIAPMQGHREHFGLTWLNSSIYVAGGFKASTFPSALNSVEEYIPETNTWNSAPSLCTKSIGTRLVTSDKIMYALEGGTQHSWERRNNFETFDVRVGKWTPSKPSKVTRFYRRGAAATCINGNIYSIGGYTQGSGGSPVVEMLDPRNEEWCMDGELPKGGIFTSVSFMNL